MKREIVLKHTCNLSAKTLGNANEVFPADLAHFTTAVRAISQGKLQCVKNVEQAAKSSLSEGERATLRCPLTSPIKKQYQVSCEI